MNSLVPRLRFKGFADNWKANKLSHYTVINPKKSDKPDDGIVSFIPMNAVTEDAKISHISTACYSDVSSGFSSFQNGDVLLAKITPCFENGKGGFADGLHNGVGFGSTEFHVLRANSGVYPKFVYHFVNTTKFRLVGERNMQGSAGQKRVTTDYLKRYKTHFPSSIIEQQKIADFLTAVDSKISLLTEKHRLLKAYKKGLMQQLFSQQIRFKDDDGKAFPEWNMRALAEVLTEYRHKTTAEGEYDVLTSSRSGLMMQSDYYGEGRITERSNIGFHVIPHGYITYRSRSDDRMFFFNLNELGKIGIISHYYPVFTMNNGQNHFFVELTRYHAKIFGKYAVGTSQVVLSYNALCEIKLQFPCSEEQQKIAQCLQAIDNKIDAVAEQIEQTKLFKKGLLQQMFV